MTMITYPGAYVGDAERCPPDYDLIEYLDLVRPPVNRHMRNLFHFGTGSHHLVGRQLAERGMNVLGITSSVEEHAAYIEAAIANPELAARYQCLFGDIYLLNDRLIPRFDYITLFHLAEWWGDEEERRASGYYPGASPLDLTLMLAGHLASCGEMIFYRGSNGWGRVAPMLEELAGLWTLQRAEDYRSLQIWRAPA